jgi:hypothetical protein
VISRLEGPGEFPGLIPAIPNAPPVNREGRKYKIGQEQFQCRRLLPFGFSKRNVPNPFFKRQLNPRIFFARATPKLGHMLGEGLFTRVLPLKFKAGLALSFAKLACCPQPSTPLVPRNGPNQAKDQKTKAC